MKPLALPCCHSPWASKQVTSTAVATYGAIPLLFHSIFSPIETKRSQRHRKGDRQRHRGSLSAGLLGDICHSHSAFL